MQSRREAGYDTSIMESWIQEAFLLLDSQGLYPSLMDTRWEDPTPSSLLTRITKFNESEWELADQVGRLNRSIARALTDGQDVDLAQSELRLATAWFDLVTTPMHTRPWGGSGITSPFGSESGASFPLLVTAASVLLYYNRTATKRRGPRADQ
jgi:hypothetical protein